MSVTSNLKSNVNQSHWLAERNKDGLVKDSVLKLTDPIFHTEHDNEPWTKEQVEDEVIKAAKEAKSHKKLLMSLRKMDDIHNRTCAKCLRRLPIEKFPRLKRSEVCEDCE